eukprot:7701300-Pyramimonas_sp.AAC.1
MAAEPPASAAAGWTNQTRGEGIYPRGGPIRRGERGNTRRVDQSDEGMATPPDPPVPKKTG